MTSPSRMNGGTWTVTPVSSLAGLGELLAVAPFSSASVSTTFNSTVAGSSTPMGLSLKNSTVRVCPFLEIVPALGQRLPVQSDLLVVFSVHEMTDISVPVEEFHFPVVQRCAVHGVPRGEAVLVGGSGPKILQQDPDKSGPLAGRPVLGLSHPVGLVLMDQDHSFPDLRGVDHGRVTISNRVFRLQF